MGRGVKKMFFFCLFRPCCEHGQATIASASIQITLSEIYVNDFSSNNENTMKLFEIVKIM